MVIEARSTQRSSSSQIAAENVDLVGGLQHDELQVELGLDLHGRSVAAGGGSLTSEGLMRLCRRTHVSAPE
jgi:hypothetical protein